MKFIADNFLEQKTFEDDPIVGLMKQTYEGFTGLIDTDAMQVKVTEGTQMARDYPGEGERADAGANRGEPDPSKYGPPAPGLQPGEVSVEQLREATKQGSAGQVKRDLDKILYTDIASRGLSGEAAIQYAEKMNNRFRGKGLPNTLTLNTNAFAQDGETETFTIKGENVYSPLLKRDRTLPDAQYTLSYDDGQVNISIDQPGVRENKTLITLEDIPEGKIKTHLTFLKGRYLENIEQLEGLGVEDPYSTATSAFMGTEEKRLRRQNAGIMGSIDFPGLALRGEEPGIFALFGLGVDKKEANTGSLLSAPSESVAEQEVGEGSSLLSRPEETPGVPSISVVEQAAAEVSEMFNDGEAATALLRETAIQESNMGQTPGTYVIADDERFGRGSFGVGQVDERTFEDTKARLRGDKGQPQNLKKYVKRFRDEHDIDLLGVEYEDLADPKLSLIFTRLHYLKTAAPIPPTAEGRAKYWKEHYNTSAGKGTPKDYLANQRAFDDLLGSN